MPGDYATIQEAMDHAQPGDTVTVAPGIYADVNEFEFHPGGIIKAVVMMKPGVTLLGRPDAPESVVIQASDSVGGIFCQDVDSSAVIVGVTVTGGRTGIMGRLASPTISHCRLVANASTYPFNSGGGMYGDFFSPDVSDCLFADNVATSGGGATFANESFPVLRRCTFANNHAFTSSENRGSGGALTVVQHSGAQVYDCSFVDNVADSLGGAFMISQAEIMVSGSIFSGNDAGGRGGALYVENESDLALDGVVLTGNEAGSLGGGIYVRGDAVITATGSQVGDNQAPAGPDGYLDDVFLTPLVSLICCTVDPAGWTGDDLVIDDSDCD